MSEKKRVQLCTESLAKYRGGELAEVLNEALDRAIRDCEDRPSLAAGRKVTLEFTIKPKSKTKGSNVQLEGVDLAYKVKDTLPAQQSEAMALDIDADPVTRKPVATFSPSRLSDEPTADFIEDEASEQAKVLDGTRASTGT